MNERVAIVTGGASGIGKAISTRLAKSGTLIAIFGRNEERGLQAVDSIAGAGGKADFYRTDLINDENIEESVRQVLAKYGHVDILVNNAAISGFMGAVADTPMKDVADVLKINLISTFHLSKLVLPKMIEKRFGRIINISSVAPRVTPANSATYNMSKAGLNALTRTLSREVAIHGITVNAIAPGLVLTERIMKSRLPGMAKKSGTTPEEVLAQMTANTDTRQLTKEEDVAELVMFLASKASQNITGEIVNIAGGF
ncbi:MAG: SDR family oxidoreductase [bacterium]|nr:SDR family oxidoreductase [bacterium]